jgi:UDP:flavonoid glycosyltransferase YjiC (YdhE family)
MRIALIALGSAGDVHPFLGIGRALAARAHDVVVFDNASRLVDLGVGGSLPHRSFSARRAATQLARLLDDAEVAARCAELRARVDGPAAIRATCDAIEAAGASVPA